MGHGLPGRRKGPDDLVRQPACRGAVGTARRPHRPEEGLFDLFRFEIGNVAVALHDLREMSLSIHLLRMLRD